MPPYDAGAPHRNPTVFLGKQFVSWPKRGGFGTAKTGILKSSERAIIIEIMAFLGTLRPRSCSFN
jgi:hypothetical protein